MQKTTLLLALFFSIVNVYAQRIDTDIFDNLIYESRDRAYRAKLEKNIFDDLIFTDSKKNKITLEKKYLDREYASVRSNYELKADLFNDLIKQYRHDDTYVATYKIDIFDKLIIQDNRGYKLERGKDIFGNEQFNEVLNGVKTSIKRNIHGDLEYRAGSANASLKKDIFNKWNYEDSLGNKFQFAPQTWERLMRKLRSEEHIFWTLIDQFFVY